MSETKRYRIWVRGAFPRVTPHYVDRSYASIAFAERYALMLIKESIAKAGNGPSYTSYEIRELSAAGKEGRVVAEWRAGE